ncbi:DUF5362 domain-containing protein [Dyella telluris]|uniref:DUF5362 domain-containing protein n=1 Tax=Dyella telluris TaxID=2763498 RepID=A0A7G8Q7L1_9GAMM|nr:DUF5362 domain-containing protein [Dyella telluris]QNK02769.1 DUF5362 domain-containing protein [Dyella telluris]
MSDSFSSLGQASTASPASPAIQDLSQPLASGKGWMKFVGVLFIIQGALTALSIVGIIIAWLLIWIGVLLMQSANAIERAQVSGDAAALKEALARLRTYFVIQAVMFIVSIAAIVVYIAVAGAMLGAILPHGGGWGR